MNPISEIPSIPTNAKVTFVNQSAVKLEWLRPKITGVQTHVYYEVECRKTCNDDNVISCDERACRSQVDYLPSKQGLIETHEVITHLSSFVTYQFRIYARNRVSEVAQMMHGIEASFALHTITTNASSEFISLSFPHFRWMHVPNNTITLDKKTARNILALVISPELQS